MARATRSGTRTDTVVLMACLVVSLFLTVLPPTLQQSFAGSVRGTFVGPLVRLQAQAERARSAFVARDIAAARLDSMALANVALADMGRENEHLRSLLGLGARLQTAFVPADALHRPALGDAQTVIVTAGSDAGVVDGSAVVAPEGLIGLVTAVTRETSTAMLWTHPDFRVSAISVDGAAFGIIAPHQGEGAERFLLELRGVAFRDSLPNGTAVVSSGLGSVFPRGIPVGVVIGELETGEGWSRTYLVRPRVVPGNVSTVMVLLPSADRSDVSGVWASRPMADSARRAIRQAAADSLPRRTGVDTTTVGGRPPR